MSARAPVSTAPAPTSAATPKGTSMVAEAAVPAGSELPSRQMFFWMFRFLTPVKWQVFLAALYLAGFCAAEVLTVRQSGVAVDDIKALQASRLAADAGENGGTAAT